MTDSDQWRRAGDLLAQALERPATERHAFVRQASGTDTRLAADVLSLLDAHDRANAGGFLEQPAAALDPGLLDEPSPLIGRQLGPYHVRSEVGRGGMGVVYLADDARLGRPVALKAIAPELCRDPRMRERLRREAQAAARLSHPAVATVYALEEYDGELFIASEFVEGRTLREEIAARPLAPEVLVETARVLASALAAAHSLGIVHRDLKPENILRRNDGQLKILDFGLARDLHVQGIETSRLTHHGEVPGTPGYMAPEQLRGEPGDTRSDVYAFGVLMYELATGDHPDMDPASRRPLKPASLNAVVARCLRSTPQERFPGGIELLSAVMASDAGITLAAATRPSAFWWWQFHQIAVAFSHAALVAALWPARAWFSPAIAMGLFYAALAIQTAAVTMRLHLWFTSRFDAEQLSIERARVRLSLRVLDSAFQGLLLAAGLGGLRADSPIAPLFFVAAIGSFLTSALIEPATSRAAFDSHDRP